MLRYLINIRSDGQFEVVDIRTGQVRFCGSFYGARMVQAQLLAAESRRLHVV